jgi:hypothetical protein
MINNWNRSSEDDSEDITLIQILKGESLFPLDLNSFKEFCQLEHPQVMPLFAFWEDVISYQIRCLDFEQRFPLNFSKSPNTPSFPRTGVSKGGLVQVEEEYVLQNVPQYEADVILELKALASQLLDKYFNPNSPYHVPVAKEEQLHVYETVQDEHTPLILRFTPVQKLITKRLQPAFLSFYRSIVNNNLTLKGSLVSLGLGAATLVFGLTLAFCLIFLPQYSKNWRLFSIPPIFLGFLGLFTSANKFSPILGLLKLR